jgi:hypothetical protein
MKKRQKKTLANLRNSKKLSPIPSGSCLKVKGGESGGTGGGLVHDIIIWPT